MQPNVQTTGKTRAANAKCAFSLRRRGGSIRRRPRTPPGAVASGVAGDTGKVAVSNRWED